MGMRRLATTELGLAMQEKLCYADYSLILVFTVRVDVSPLLCFVWKSSIG